jgi:short-subunit dehydrogenase
MMFIGTKRKRMTNYLLPIGITAAGIGALLANRHLRRQSLAGRVALITAGSRGLGLELARKLAAQGCHLILVARKPEELSRAAEDLSTRGVRVHTIACDLTQKAEIARMIEEALQHFHRLDILINNAGEITVGPVDAFHESEFARAMDIMFWAGVRTTFALLPSFLRSGNANIVNITSIGGKIAVPHLLPYTAAKFAMTGFSEGLQSELRGRGVHVLTVTPGLMRTGAHLHAEFAGRQEQEYRWFALGASLPGASMNVSRAADQIVNALVLRKRELVLTLSARSAARAYGTLPQAALRLLELVNYWILPAPSRESAHKTGEELHSEQTHIFKAMTRLGTKAARLQNQSGGSF